MHRVFIAALCTVAKIRKQHKYPLPEEWTKNVWGILYVCVCVYKCVYTHTHIHNGILL